MKQFRFDCRCSCISFQPFRRIQVFTTNMYYKLITFDVTNTLLKFRVSAGQQYAKVGSLYGVNADPDKLTAAFKTQWKILNNEHPNFGANTVKPSDSPITSSEWWKKLVFQTFCTAGYPLNNKNLNDIADHLIQIYNTSVCWDVRPGAKTMLENLRKQKVSLGIISNFDERLHNVLSDTGLLHLFDFVLASYIAKCYKPQTEIFNLALDIIKCAPSQAVHIGDDVHLDYLAARKAGWDALLLKQDSVDEEAKSNLIEPASIITSMSEINFILNRS